MITNVRIYTQFCRNLLRKEQFSYQQALRIYEALLEEAIVLGCIDKDSILEGLDIDIHIASILNSLK